MAGRTMNLSVLVRLVDKITGPLGALQRRFAQFAALGQRIGILGAAAAAISFAAPIASAAAFDQVLRDMAVTAGAFGAGAEQMIKTIGADMHELALKVGIASSELANARGLLIAGGMDDTLVTKLMPTIGRVSKAASAVPLDMAKTAGALAENLKVSAEDMEQSLAMLTVAGKLGRFELKDMARELPALTAEFRGLGITGKAAVASLGASLQVAMLGTDSTATAANNFKNFLSKLSSPEVSKTFAKAGVDLGRLQADAIAKGINPMEAVVQKVMTLTRMPEKEIDAIYKKAKGSGKTDAEAMGDVRDRIKQVLSRSALGKLFTDQQALDFISAMVLNIEKYKDFHKEISEAGLDVIAKDFATQFAGLSTQMKISEEIGTQMAIRIGNAFGQNLPWINAFGITLLQWVHQLDQDFPGMVDTVVSGFGAFLALVAGLALTGPVFTVLSAAFGALAAVIALVLSPLGLLLAALAGIAYLIYQDWEGFAPFFSELWEGIKSSFSGVVEFFKALFAGDWAGMEAGLATAQAGLSRAGQALVRIAARLLPMIGNALRAGGAALMGWLDNLFGGWPSKIAKVIGGIGTAIGAGISVVGGQLVAWAGGIGLSIMNALGIDLGAMTAKGSSMISGLWDGAKSMASSVLSWAGGWAGELIDELSSWEDKDWAAAGTRIGNSIADSVKAAIDGLVGWFSGLPGRILAAVGSIDLSSIIKWPSFLGGSAGPAAPAAANENTPGTGGEKQARFAPPGGPKFPPPASLAGGNTNVGGHITVAAARGSEIQSVESSNKNVPLEKSDNGRVVGRV